MFKYISITHSHYDHHSHNEVSACLPAYNIAGGEEMKLFANWFCGNRNLEKWALEDRLAQLSIFWRWIPGSPETACQQRWMKGLAGEWEPWGIDRGQPSCSSSSSSRTFWTNCSMLTLVYIVYCSQGTGSCVAVPAQGNVWRTCWSEVLLLMNTHLYQTYSGDTASSMT